MLTIVDRAGDVDCGGMKRRDFLRAGVLGTGCLSLPWLLRTKAEAAASGAADFVRDKSVILLFLAGGPSQHETFDPKMDAPSSMRSVHGEVSTSIPGVIGCRSYAASTATYPARRRAIIRP